MYGLDAVTPGLGTLYSSGVGTNKDLVTDSAPSVGKLPADPLERLEQRLGRTAG